MRIHIGIDPVLFSIGSLEFRWYSLAIMVAILVGTWVVSREWRRLGLDETRFSSVALWGIASGILGARLFHILDRAGYYLDHPGRILDFQSGGLAIYGAVIGGFLGVVVGCWIERVPWLPAIDAVAPGLALAQAIGRFGCIINGDAWGARTDSPFAFVYTNPDALIPNRLIGEPTHPYPVYDMALNLAIFALLWKLRERRLPHGALFATFIAVYGVGRFVISWVREERVWFWGVQEAQVISIIGVIIAGATLAYLMRRRAGAGGAGMQAGTAG